MRVLYVLLAESKFLVSGAADNNMKLWEVQSGKCLFTWEFPTAIKRVAFSEDDSLIACITEQRMGFQGAIRIFEINRLGKGTDRMCFSTSFGGRNSRFISEILESLEPISIIHPIASKATVVIWHGNEHVVTGHESGQLCLYQAKTGEEVVSNQHAHREIVTDIQMAPDRSYFVTSSKDKSAKVCADGVRTIREGPDISDSSS